MSLQLADFVDLVVLNCGIGVCLSQKRTFFDRAVGWANAPWTEMALIVVSS
jgi:hypothetical protein